MTEPVALRLYNSLNREKQDFLPIDPAHVRLYACGPTVYNYAHIGNARMAVVFDVLTRVLKSLYPKVTYVSNITDVDDKIMAASRETGEPIDSITRKYTDIYNGDMQALGCALPDVQPRATTHIGEMVALIEQLIGRGMAYESDGHVLFDVPAYGDAYGILSGRSRDEQIAGARVEVASYKKDPADFVLWKPSASDEPGWESPWGRGRPGWHIECSAMAEKHLDLPFDIHGGGADLKFPHHENEIAQSCGAHNLAPQDFARFWVHNGFVTVEGEKMSKSLGNVTLVHDLLQHFSGAALRLTLLSAQYSKPLDWSVERIRENEKFLQKITGVLADLESVRLSTNTYGDFYQKFQAALCDDLNTPKAFAELNVLLSSIRKDIAGAGRHLGEQKQQLLAMLSLIGLTPEFLDESRKKQQSAVADTACAASGDDAGIDDLVQQRTQAKKDKNFARADEIRAELSAMGIEVTDTPAGAVWKRI